MNKYYPTKELVAGWLTEAGTDRRLGGIKNIIGLVVKHNDEEFFYSILDDCFFKILPSKQERISNNDIYTNKLFVEVYGILQSVGEVFYKKIKTDFITKDEIIKYRSLIVGYYSDFDYIDKLEIDTKVDYEDNLAFDRYIISSEPEYREKQGRPITYDEKCIYGPVKNRKL